MWSTPADIAKKVQRRWNDGSLLRAYALGEPFPIIDIPLRGPNATHIGLNWEGVQHWINELMAGQKSGRSSHYQLVWKPIGGREIGRNQIPARAVISEYQQAWALLGVTKSVAKFSYVWTMTQRTPELAKVQAWVLANPLRALELADVWEQLMSTYQWLVAARGSNRYLREISAPGVDTKFAERHLKVLAELLEAPTAPNEFLTTLGLAVKPQIVRFRASSNLLFPDLGQLISEFGFRAEELPNLTVKPKSAIVIENEITYLSVPIPVNGIVFWGKGFEAHLIGRIPWLKSIPITYWGDIDTHGFAILNQLRTYLPQTVSVLMDYPTLMAHQDRWGTEPAPTRALLTNLTPAEAELYQDLVTDRYGDRIRLEQERLDWPYALRALSTDLS